MILVASSQATSGTQRFLLFIVIFAKNKVKVGRGGHSIEDVSFVWHKQLSFGGDDLCQCEIQVVHVFKVVLLQCSLNDLGSLVLAGQQYAFVHVSVVVSQVNTDSNDAGVVYLSVIDRQRGHGHGALM